ncbi:MAG: efflux RND transporter periplasmic adaptor subunit [Deltaproteobacteria bacterium]|nr:efflux RND transporter periplasmic adaptor subunit [Deltaproteobacteria bacterium]MCB2186305.1 efflux RND transporter periplasmic adaptor subunit [Deltaproteobacteria bacterium]
MKAKPIAAVLLGLGIFLLSLMFWNPADTKAKEAGRNEVESHGESHQDAGKAASEHAREPAPGEEGKHDDDGHGPHEDVVHLSESQVREYGLELHKAQPGLIKQYVELPGEVIINADRLVHVVPRVSGIALEVRKTEGDTVKSEEILAILESRELADAKAAYLAAVERDKLAESNFAREARLWKQKVTSEQEYLAARQARAEARIAKNSAEQQLHALGLSEDYLKRLPSQPHISYTRLEIKAPFSGTVINRHITLGEKVDTDEAIYAIADLSTVWVDLNVYQKDLSRVRQGNEVTMDLGRDVGVIAGKIAWVGPLIGEATRTAKARVVVPNPSGNLRPGLFVTARVAVGNQKADLVVEKSALQTFENQTVLFLRTEKGFEPQAVSLGKQNTSTVEIISGLEPGQIYVGRGAFLLKAQLSKASFGDGHNH